MSLSPRSAWPTATSLLLLAQAAHAQVTFVATRAEIAAQDTLDWAVLGVAGTTVSQPFEVWTTDLSRQVEVAKATPGVFTRLDQDGPSTHLAWDGNFLPAEALLYTSGTAGPLSLTFDSPVQAVGLQIQKADQANPDFLACIEAYDPLGISLGRFDLTGYSNDAADGSALFLGVRSGSMNILRIEVAECWGEAFAVNQVSIHVPEPAGGLLTGLFALALATVARYRRGTHPPHRPAARSGPSEGSGKRG
jgi:hypothetical protein